MRMNLAVAGINHQPLIVRLVNQNIQEFLPYPLVPPPDKAAVGVAPSAIIRRKVTPRGSGPQYPENRVDKLAIVLGHPAPNPAPTR